MAVKEILKIGNDTLRKTSHPVEKFNLRLWLLLRDMADTMYKAEGVGLAGDWCLGHRLEDAFVSGLELALRMLRD